MLAGEHDVAVKMANAAWQGASCTAALQRVIYSLAAACARLQMRQSSTEAGSVPLASGMQQMVIHVNSVLAAKLFFWDLLASQPLLIIFMDELRECSLRQKSFKTLQQKSCRAWVRTCTSADVRHL